MTQPTRRHHGHDPERQAVYNRRRLLVASAVTAIPLGAWWAFGGRGRGEGVATAPASDATPAPPPSSESTITAPTSASTAPTTTTPEVPPLDHNLVVGNVDPKVGIMQQRLTDLAFDPGPVDDYFGEATVRSVWAFQKLVMGVPREDASGVVSDELWERLHGPVDITPRRTPGGTHLEVYLPEQVAALFDDGRPAVISHVSSGAGVEWCDEVLVDLDDGTEEVQGICGLSITPGGVYHFERKVEGWRNAKLGQLYKPVYFNFGIAIHGANNVPNYPVSRGCVRYPMHIAEYIQDMVELGDMVYVFDGVEEPEVYGAQPMIFDWPDPDFTTTTTTTTTVPESTVPETTVPDTTTPSGTIPTTADPAPTTAPPGSAPSTTGPTSTTVPADGTPATIDPSG